MQLCNVFSELYLNEKHMDRISLGATAGLMMERGVLKQTHYIF